MKRSLTIAKFLGLAAAILLGTEAASAQERRQVLVLFKNAPAAPAAARFASPSAALRSRSAARPFSSALARSTGAKKDLWVANGYALEASASDLAALAADPNVEVVENFEVKTPEVEVLASGSSAAMENWGLAKIGAQAAWRAFGVTGRGVRVGHLDTGVDASHPDLNGKVAAWAEFNADGDEVPGSRPHDSGIHGTHTAGTIVGGSASGAAIGVAPGAQLVSALVLNGNSGTLIQVLAGMQWVLDPDGNPLTDDGAQILSMSLGAAGQYPIFQDVTDRLIAAGVLPVFAIGNSGAGRADAPGNCAGAVSVGATMYSDVIASFSGGGVVTWNGQAHVKPEISAPGYGIPSAIPGNRYQTLSGTSMATPHVAGAAALLLEASPSLTVQRLREVLMGTAQDLGAIGQDTRFGAGRLDVSAALAEVTERSVVQGVARGQGAPVAAAIRIRTAAGRVVHEARANADTGRFEVALTEGDYVVEGSYGAAKGVERTVTVTKGAVVTVDFSFSGAAGLDNLLAYPNPFRPAVHGRMTFDGLPLDTKVAVYTLSGEKVAEVSGGASGSVQWDGRSESGETLASGPYFFIASRYDESNGWEHKKGMVAVLK